MVQASMSLNEETKARWLELVKRHRGTTRLRLTQPFEITAVSPSKHSTTLAIPAGTEVMLFINMTGTYRRSSTASQHTLATFYLPSMHVSIMSNLQIRLTQLKTVYMTPRDSTSVLKHKWA